jgi:NTE family protein
MDAKEGNKGKPIFDIIAGTSIGAINAAVLVSYVVENQTYEGSAERLVDFWNYLSKESIVETSPFFKSWWDYWHKINRDVASGEAARRYYSAKEFAILGVIEFPIATTKEDDQPRLLLVAVDVADGIPVTFDSYPKEDGTRKTEYGRFLTHNNKEIGFEHVAHYEEGITSEHVIARGSFPVNFDFAEIEVESYNPASRGTLESSNLEDNAIKNGNNYGYTKEMRYFWDGGLMTNTPLMQLVLLHRNYWYRIRGLKDTVPRLGICVINLHPKKQAEIPTERDGVVNRNNDITFSDRTQNEETMLLLASDYIDLVRGLIKVAEEHGVKEEIINNFLNQKTRYHGEFLKPGDFWT